MYPTSPVLVPIAMSRPGSKRMWVRFRAVYGTIRLCEPQELTFSGDSSWRVRAYALLSPLVDFNKYAIKEADRLTREGSASDKVTLQAVRVAMPYEKSFTLDTYTQDVISVYP